MQLVGRRTDRPNRRAEAQGDLQWPQAAWSRGYVWGTAPTNAKYHSTHCTGKPVFFDCFGIRRAWSFLEAPPNPENRGKLFRSIENHT